jgi:hypothetical protein
MTSEVKVGQTPGSWEVSGDYIFAGDVAVPIASAHKEWATTRGGYLHQIAQANAAFIVKACNAHADLVKALEEIAKGQGAFSRDPLAHASNTIDDMKALAREALAQVPE